jgi:hypothetical protein
MYLLFYMGVKLGSPSFGKIHRQSILGVILNLVGG